MADFAAAQPDFLGRASEYRLRKFAEGSGQSAGVFFIPMEVGCLMAHLIRPKSGEECHDPTSRMPSGSTDRSCRPDCRPTTSWPPVREQTGHEAFERPDEGDVCCWCP